MATNELTPKVPHNTLMAWSGMKEQAQILLKSGFLPPALNTPEKIMSVVASGRELGLGMMQSIRNIDVIQGHPSIKPRLMLAMAFDRGLIDDVKFKSSKTEATFQVKRKGMSWHTETFTMEKAKQLGLTNKDNWKKQPDTMLLWRCISAGMNLMFPDCLFGMTTPEEHGAKVQVNPNDPLDAEIVDEAPPVPPEPPPPPPDVQSEAELTPEIGLMLDEIKEKLSQMNDGDVDIISAHLKKLTAYKDKKTKEEKWLTMEDLDGIARSRPSWIKGLHKKVVQNWSEVFTETGEKK